MHISLGGLVGGAFAPSAEGRYFEPRSGQVKDWTNLSPVASLVSVNIYI